MPSINALARSSALKAISLTCLLVLVPVLAYGAGLGRINIKSSLGEPLNADIELLEISAKEASTLVARIGNNDEYLTAGLQDAIVPPGVRVASVTRPDGTHVLHVTTPRAVNEPFLELLIKVDSDNLHMVRQYTVLLDPPVSKMGDEPAVINTIPELKSQGLVADVPPPFEAKSKSRRSRARATNTAVTVPVNLPVTGDTYLTQPGDIFGKVAQQYQPAGVPLKKVMAAFYAANPDAFLNGDINQLKSGQVLKIPSPEAMGGPLPNQAKPAAVVEVPPPAAPKSADAPPNPEFVLKISPGDSADAAEPASQTGQAVANGSTDGKGADPQATPTPEPVAPAPAATQPATLTPTLPTAANQPQPGFWETVLDRLVWIGLGLLLGLVSLGMVYYLHMRRLTAMQKWHDSMVQSTTRPHPNDVEPTVVASTPAAMPVQTLASPAPVSSAPVIVAAVAQDAEEAAPVASAPDAASQETDFDIHEVDPVVEAEIYISYGRDEQAENILLNALEKTPDRHELTLSLLKIYAERQDALAFDHLALRLQQAAENAEPGTLAQWHSAAVMGHRLSPHNPLYVIEGLTDETPSEPEDEEDSFMLPELEPIAEESPVLPEFEPLKPLAETNILEFTFEKIPAADSAKKSALTEEHEVHDPLFPAEKK